MASYEKPAHDLEIDGSTDQLDQLKSEQARLLQQLSSSDSEPNSAAAFSDSPSAISPSDISMPGLQPFPKAGNQLPSSWSDCTLSGYVPFCLVPLNGRSWEFQSILAEFTAAKLSVRKIERVENRDLWDTFEFERNRMQKNRRAVNEVYLFHGTTADKEQICHEGLDQRLSRIGYFGRGIYFSNDPRKCVSYTQSDKEKPRTICTIYKCRALLGNMKVYSPGEHAKDLKREPEVEKPEPGGPKYYDSVKGHVKLYDEFILYKSDRVMPEYVISCYMPAGSSGQESQAAPTAAASTDHGDSRDGDLYGLDQEEVSAELEAGAVGRPVGETDGRGSPEDLYGGADEEEISAELQADALGPPGGRVGKKRVKALPDEETSLELTAEGSETLEVASEESHPELEEDGDVYEQLHQKEILEAIQKRREKAETERQKERAQARRKERARGEPHHLTVNQLEEEEGASVELAHKHGRAVPQRQGKLDLLKDSRRHRDEAIAPELLPTVLEVRESVREARKKAQETERRDQIRGAPRGAERKIPRWVRDDAAAEAAEYAENQKLMARGREMPYAERRAKELEQRRSQRDGRPPRVTDNSLSPGWKEEEEATENDGVQEVLDVLLVQFMDVTACDDVQEARECIMKANMDVNQAIIAYING